MWYNNDEEDIWHRNPDPGLGQAQKCGRVKPVTENPTHDWDTVESSYIKLSLLEISDKLKFFWSPILNLELFNWIDSSSSKFWISGSNFSVHDKVYAVESAIMKFTGPKFDLRQVRDIYK
jgi:hypothetical protein